MKIAILGGAFNPPHLGHQFVSEQALDFFGFDQVWLMPCFEHPFHKELAPLKDRLVMTGLLETKRIKLSLFEAESKKVNFTLETLDALAAIYPKNKFSWIIGSDILLSFKKWGDWEKLLENYQFIVFPRDDQPKTVAENIKSIFKTPAARNFLVADFRDLAITNISSSNIRDRLRKNLPLDYLAPEKVIAYINTHNLYKEKNL